MDKFHLINVFVSVVDQKGFAGAARKLDMSPPAVTRAINELETALGLRLLTRTTRTVRVTEAGERYAQDCRRILGEMLEADESVTGMHTAPRGRLSITAPVLFGSKYVTPIVTEYLSCYPEVSASCLFLDRVVNLLDEGVDLAFRIGQLPDSSMQAIPVGKVRRVICGSPAYFARHGKPMTPGDLSHHTIISASSVTPSQEWKFIDQGETSSVHLTARMITSSNDSAINAALNGFGITRLMSYQIAQQVHDGQLEMVLQDYEPAPLPIHILHREGRRVPQRVRSFLDLAVKTLRQDTRLNAVVKS